MKREKNGFKILRFVALSSSGCFIIQKGCWFKVYTHMSCPFFGHIFAPLFLKNAPFFAPVISNLPLFEMWQLCQCSAVQYSLCSAVPHRCIEIALLCAVH